MRASGIVEVLTGVLADLSARGGAGAGALDINLIVEELVRIAKAYKQFDGAPLFQIPPYFAYVIRAYSVLQALGTQDDPAFSILEASYPYLARRLLTDPSPRTQRALRDMLYGSTGASTLDLQRLVSLAQGASAFSASTSTAAAGAAADAKRRH